MWVVTYVSYKIFILQQIIHITLYHNMNEYSERCKYMKYFA